MTVRNVDSKVLLELAGTLRQGRQDLESRFNTARSRVDSAPGGWNRQPWDGIPSFIRMELEALDRDQRELVERAAKIDIVAAVHELPEGLPLSALKFLLSAVSGSGFSFYLAGGAVTGLVAAVSAFTKEFTAKNGKPPVGADFVGLKLSQLQSGVASAGRRLTQLSDGAAFGLLNGVFPVVADGGTGVFKFSREEGVKVAVVGGKRGEQVEVERLPDGTFRVRMTESVGGSASVVVGAEGKLRVNEHELRSGAAAEAGGRANTTRSTVFQFDPKKQGDMSKMAALLAGSASPAMMGGLRAFPPSLKDNLVEYEIGADGGLFAEGSMSNGVTTLSGSAGASGGAVVRRTKDGWETVYTSDVGGEASFSHLGASTSAGESYNTQRIVRSDGQEILLKSVTTTDRSLAEAVAQASLAEHERFVIEEQVDASTGASTVRIYAEDDMGLDVEASARVGAKAHLGIHGEAEISAGTRRLIFEKSYSPSVVNGS